MGGARLEAHERRSEGAEIEAADEGAGDLRAKPDTRRLKVVC